MSDNFEDMEPGAIRETHNRLEKSYFAAMDDRRHAGTWKRVFGGAAIGAILFSPINDRLHLAPQVSLAGEVPTDVADVVLGYFAICWQDKRQKYFTQEAVSYLADATQLVDPAEYPNTPIDGRKSWVFRLLPKAHQELLNDRVNLAEQMQEVYSEQFPEDLKAEFEAAAQAEE